MRRPRTVLLAALTVLLAAVLPVAAQEQVLLEAGSPMTYLANSTDPAIGLSWTLPAFDDSLWSVGVYGAGFETTGGAENLIQTAVAAGTVSLYTRSEFTIADVSQVQSLWFGADHDDGYTVWLNGVEVLRSPEMPAGAVDWNTVPTAHESSNALAPVYTGQDISAAALPALQNGTNVLAVGVWNTGPTSSDLVIVPQLIRDPAQSLARGPYLQRGSATEVTVRWRTELPTDSRVDYGLDPATLTSSMTDPLATTEHSITLGGLSPDETYFYAVGDAAGLLVGGDTSHFFVTAPATGTSKPTRVWVLGDSGTANQDARNVRDAYELFTGTQHTDLWLMLGDNAYPNGTDAEYQAALFDIFPDMLRKSVLWSTLGNHDTFADSPTGTGTYYDVFTLPTAAEAGGVASGFEAYYSFDYGNVHFVVLDSQDTDRSVGGGMMTWLEADLAATFQDWIVAFWHHPPYTKGSHDSDTELPLVEMRQNALPILESHGVDLVLSGHSHSYERSFLIDGHYGDSTTFVEGMKVDGGDGNVVGDGAYEKPSLGPDPNQGAVYAVAGSSGKLTATGTLDHPAMFVSLLSMGSLVLDFDDDRLDATFLDDAGVTQDSFTIIKGSNCPDPDGDGVCSNNDNCPTVSNPGQEDADGDDFGDVCDSCPIDPDNDADGDGLCADEDNCPNTSNPAQLDADADGVGDACDTCPSDPANDIDADGVCGDVDNCPFQSNSNQQDSDGDGSGDVCDPCPLDPDDDIDADGVCGDVDNCPDDANPSQQDSDGDGKGDVCDPCPFDAGNTDSDGDGVPDGCDCADGSPGVAFPPGQVGPTLTLARGLMPSVARLSWNRGLYGHVSNVYRTVPSVSEIAGCISSEDPTVQTADGFVPPVGVTIRYLISAENSCGESAVGDDGSGATRGTPGSCPPLDQDVDHDGVRDVEDNCALDFDPSLADADLDFVGDLCDNCPAKENSGQQDQDGDGKGDICDNCPVDANGGQADVDADGVGNVCDNCRNDPNPRQEDRDQDGVGDECDNCPDVFNPDQADADGDGKGDACE